MSTKDKILKASIIALLTACYLISGAQFYNARIVKACEADGTYLSETDQQIIRNVRDAYAEKYGTVFSVNLLYAWAEVESSGNPKAVDPTGTYYGMYQINPTLHEARYYEMGFVGEPDWKDTATSTWVALNYLDELRRDNSIPYITEDKTIEFYDPDISLCLAIYNGDSRAYEDGYFSKYAERILERAAELDRLEEEKCEQ